MIGSAVSKTLRLFSLACLAFSAVAIALLMLIGAVDVIGTQFFNHPVPSGIEFQEVIEAAMIFLALPMIQRNNAHIAVDFLTSRFGPIAQRWSAVLAYLCAAVVFALLTTQAWALFMESVRYNELSDSLLAFPVYPFKLAIVIGSAGALLESLRQLVTAAIFGQTEAQSGGVTI